LVIGSVNAGARTENVFEPFVATDSGVLTIKATAATMRNVPAGRYVYDLQQIVPSSTSSDDTHTTILRGSFTVNEDVAKSLSATRPERRLR
jgi:hypothetical protein